VVLRNGLVPVNAIGEKIGLTSGWITTAVDRLKGILFVSAMEERAGAMERTASGLTVVEWAQVVALPTKLRTEARRLLR